MVDNLNNTRLESRKSVRISLTTIRENKAGLDAHRVALLARVPETGDWAAFSFDKVDIDDLAYLTAYTEDEFALLKGKKMAILLHGDKTSCTFGDDLVDYLKTKKLSLEAHSHPGEDIPMPSNADRHTLEIIEQESSIVISATTGIKVEYYQNSFHDVITDKGGSI